jgi:hypothetical protein
MLPGEAGLNVPSAIGALPRRNVAGECIAATAGSGCEPPAARSRRRSPEASLSGLDEEEPDRCDVHIWTHKVFDALRRHYLNRAFAIL